MFQLLSKPTAVKQENDNSTKTQSLSHSLDQKERCSSYFKELVSIQMCSKLSKLQKQYNHPYNEEKCHNVFCTEVNKQS